MTDDALAATVPSDALAAEEIQKPNDMAAQIRRSAELKGYERGLKEAQAQVSPGLSPADIERISNETFEKRLQDMRVKSQQEAQAKMVQQMEQKYNMGVMADKADIPDYDAAMEKLGALKELPELKMLAGESGSAGHFMREMAENPKHALSLAMLLQTELQRGVPPTVAIEEAKKVAAAARANIEAKRNVDIREPLSQFKSSGTNAAVGKPSVEELRKNDPRYRS